MKRLLLLVLLISSAFLFSQEKTLEEKVYDLAKTIVQKYPDKTTTKIGVYFFLTEDGKLNNLGKYLGDELNEQFSKFKKFQTGDREVILKEFKNAKFDYNGINNQAMLEKIAQNVFNTTNEIPEVFLFGILKDNDDVIKLTVKIVSVATGNNKLNFVYNLKPDDKTDQLLGKPPRPKIKKVDTVVVTKEVIKEKIVPVEKVVIKEKIVPVEKVIIKEVPAKEEIKKDEIAKVGLPKELKFGNFRFVFTKSIISGGKLIISFNVVNTGDDESLIIASSRTRIITEQGNEYVNPTANLGSYEGHFANMKMISNVKVNGSFEFPNIKASEKNIQVLEMYMNDKTIQLKDIPIEKE